MTGGAEAVSPTEAVLFGEVDARGDSVPVFFEYGLDGVTFPNSEAIVGATVSGLGLQDVSAQITQLEEGLIYFYRLRAGDWGQRGVRGDERIECAGSARHQSDSASDFGACRFCGFLAGGFESGSR